MTPIPENIMSSVSVLLQPYGVDVSQLLKAKENGVEVRYMTPSKAAMYCGLSKKTIREKAFRNEIKSIRIGKTMKSRVLIDKLSLDNWLDSYKNNQLNKEE